MAGRDGEHVGLYVDVDTTPQLPEVMGRHRHRLVDDPVFHLEVTSDRPCPP